MQMINEQALKDISEVQYANDSEVIAVHIDPRCRKKQIAEVPQDENSTTIHFRRYCLAQHYCSRLYKSSDDEDRKVQAHFYCKTCREHVCYAWYLFGSVVILVVVSSFSFFIVNFHYEYGSND